MQANAPWQMLADAVLLVHVALVLFVVGGLVVIVIGNGRGWPWVNRPWFRALHLAAILIVVAEAWLGVTCPLTTLENALRERTGTAGYATSFIEYWLQRVLYYDAPEWVFACAYSVFALLVIAVWWRWPPRWRRAGHEHTTSRTR
jgi:hypothetical protein